MNKKEFENISRLFIENKKNYEGKFKSKKIEEQADFIIDKIFKKYKDVFKNNPSIEVPIDKLYLGRSNCYIQVKVLSIFDLVQLYFLMDTNVFKEMLKNKNLLKTIKYKIIDIDSLGSFQYSDVIDNCSSTVSFDRLKICNFIISGVINKKIRMFVFNLNSSFKFIENLPGNALLF